MAIWISSACCASADVLWLRGGERLVGKILSEEAHQVVFDSQNLGKTTIPRRRIERIERDGTALSPAAPPTPASPAPSVTNSPPEFHPWMGLPLEKTRFDWIQLKSGEWLKGHMKSLQDEKLEFDSEELDFREFDWEDIHMVYLPGLNSVWFGDHEIALGSVFVTTNEVRVVGLTTNVFSRSELVAVTPTGKKERNNWSAKVSAGLTLRSGNVNQADANAHVTIDRRTPSTHLSFDYLGNYAMTEGDETVNNHRVAVQFDYFLSRRLFVRVPFIEYYRDPLQNLAHRLTIGGGVGYDFIKNRRVEWNFTAGPAYQRNWHESVGPGENDQQGALALVLGSQLDVELTKRIDFIAELRSQLTSREVGETTYHGAATLEFNIHKRLDLDLSFIWDRVSNPKTDASGVTPKQDDFRLIVALGVDF